MLSWTTSRTHHKLYTNAVYSIQAIPSVVIAQPQNSSLSIGLIFTVQVHTRVVFPPVPYLVIFRLIKSLNHQILQEEPANVEPPSHYRGVQPSMKQLMRLVKQVIKKFQQQQPGRTICLLFFQGWKNETTSSFAPGEVNYINEFHLCHKFELFHN